MSEAKSGGPAWYVPVGYVEYADWIKEECRRRGFDATDPAHNNEYSRAYDDLANFLGQNDTGERKLALCVEDSGAELSVPVMYWRQPPRERARAISGVINAANGWGSRIRGRWFLRADLRLDMTFDDAPAKVAQAAEPPKSKGGRLADYDWPSGVNAAWAAIYCRELVPRSQAEVMRFLQHHLSDSEGGPKDTQAKKYAKMIYDKFLSSQ